MAKRARKVRRIHAAFVQQVVKLNARCTKKADRVKKGASAAWNAAWERVYNQCMFPSGHPGIPGARKRRPRARK